MELEEVGQKIEASHGLVASFPRDVFGYFGWPTVTRFESGTLAVVASGMRSAHVCPFGRTVLCLSSDEGESWGSPRVITDTPMDDRDAGIVDLGGGRILVSWFSSDTRKSPHISDLEEGEDPAVVSLVRSELETINDGQAKRWSGFWIRTSDDSGETWNAPIRVGISSPHGPILLANGKLLFFGKGDPSDLFEEERRDCPIVATVSGDGGTTWEGLGSVPIIPETRMDNYYEPHVVELLDGRLLGMIRLQDRDDRLLEELGEVSFSMAQTLSVDGGHTWSLAEPLGFHGSPPHLLAHSSGALVCTYGYRQEPYGERAMISLDGGASWRFHYILRDDGPDPDLGYPSSIELSDGSIYTVYYQKIEDPDEKCSLLWSRWKLP